jgi:flagellin
MRINHNVAALNALRNLNRTDDEMGQSLERLSSGQKVNRAADGPAALVISEQMRGQISSVKQAIQNSEASISMVQTAEAAMNEINNLLVSIRQLAIHAANEGANDSKMLAADQAEVFNALDTIDRIARTSQFGTRTLLDGSNGANGVAVGDGLDFVAASPDTKSSPADGYAVNITRSATRAEKRGLRPITLEDLQADDGTLKREFSVSVIEGGKTISFSLDNNEDATAIQKTLDGLKRNPAQYDRGKVAGDIRKVIAQLLQRKADQSGLNVMVAIEQAGGDEVLVTRHKEFGSRPTFFVSSTVDGILSQARGTFERADMGLDVEGTIDGKIAVGDGETLRGAEATATQGLVVRFQSIRNQEQRLRKEDDRLPVESLVPPKEGARFISKRVEGDDLVVIWETPRDIAGDTEGYVHVTQNSLSFQVGPTRGQQVRISLLDSKTDRLATGIKNESGFRSLREVNVTNSQGAQDALLLVDDAIGAVSSVRANLGAFQKNTLQSNTNSMRVAHENLTSAESSLRDADMAEEMSTFTRNQIMLASGVAMLAQANQAPKAVLQLLNERAA